MLTWLTAFLIKPSEIDLPTANNVALGVIKIMFVITGILYVLFAGLVVRQVSIMKKTLITPFSSVIEMVGYLHLFIAILVLLFFIFLWGQCGFFS